MNLLSNIKFMSLQHSFCQCQISLSDFSHWAALYRITQEYCEWSFYCITTLCNLSVCKKNVLFFFASGSLHIVMQTLALFSFIQCLCLLLKLMRNRETPECSAWQRSAVQTASCPSETFHVDLYPITLICSKNSCIQFFHTYTVYTFLIWNK